MRGVAADVAVALVELAVVDVAAVVEAHRRRESAGDAEVHVRELGLDVVLEVALFDTRGNQIARESLYEDDDEDEDEDA